MCNMHEISDTKKSVTDLRAVLGAARTFFFSVYMKPYLI